MDITVSRTKDRKVIETVLYDPDIYRRLGVKRLNGKQVPINDDIHYLEARQDGQLAGLFILHPVNKDIKIHINILKPFRKTAAIKAGLMAIQYGLDLPFENVIAAVPKKFKEVYFYARSVGFKGSLTNDEYQLTLDKEKFNGIYQ